MTVRPIIIAPDPILMQVSTPVGEITPDIRALIADMIDTMYDADGIGLAAVQVGVPLRILVIDTEGKNGPHRPRVYINPESTPLTQTPGSYVEGCLSVPRSRAEVRRPQRVRVTYRDANGAACDETLEGLDAVCLQHEIDHLNGILFIDHLPKLQRSMLLERCEKFKRERVRGG